MRYCNLQSERDGQMPRETVGCWDYISPRFLLKPGIGSKQTDIKFSSCKMFQSFVRFQFKVVVLF